MMGADPRFYRYILRHDDGWAPCSDNGQLSLATCKPRIRRAARVGDYVAGYQPKGKGEGLLCWFGRISHILQHEDYSRVEGKRRDANYALDAAGRWHRRDPAYYPDQKQMDADLSGPVLMFDMASTWYLGSEPAQPPTALEPLRAIGQGHRVNYRQAGDVEAMLAWLNSLSEPGILFPPRDAASDCGSGCVPRPPRKPGRKVPMVAAGCA